MLLTFGTAAEFLPRCLAAAQDNAGTLNATDATQACQSSCTTSASKAALANPMVRSATHSARAKADLRCPDVQHR